MGSALGSESAIKSDGCRKMSDLNIQISGGKTQFLPGEEIKGRITWRLNPKDHALELRLFWFTQGKGTSDVGIVGKIPFENPLREGGSDFRFVLPDAPHSFSGRLISLVWALELVALKTKAAQRVEFIMGPDGGEITLSSMLG